MKQSEIKVGGVYSDGSDRRRTVIDIVQDNTLYGGGRMAVDYRAQPFGKNRIKQIFLDTFASWAKERVE